jgi:hypothetical protein
MQYDLFPRHSNQNYFEVLRLLFFSPVAQQPNWVYDAPFFMFIRHAQYAHTHTVGLLRTSYQPDEEATTYLQQKNGHLKLISIPLAGFEP